MLYNDLRKRLTKHEINLYMEHIKEYCFISIFIFKLTWSSRILWCKIQVHTSYMSIIWDGFSLTLGLASLFFILIRCIIHYVISSWRTCTCIFFFNWYILFLSHWFDSKKFLLKKNNVCNVLLQCERGDNSCMKIPQKCSEQFFSSFVNIFTATKFIIFCTCFYYVNFIKLINRIW